MNKFVWLALAPLLAAAGPAFSQIHVDNAWARATPPGAKIAAGYMTIRNDSASADRLVSASSPAAARVQTHVTKTEGGISRMREVKGYDIPANGSFELTPGGSHLMLVDIKAPLKAGERVPLVLRFQHAGEMKVELEVRPLGASGGMGGMHGHGH
jgi:copper(I)-binding protein